MSKIILLSITFFSITILGISVSVDLSDDSVTNNQWNNNTFFYFTIEPSPVPQLYDVTITGGVSEIQGMNFIFLGRRFYVPDYAGKFLIAQCYCQNNLLNCTFPEQYLVDWEFPSNYTTSIFETTNNCGVVRVA